MRPYDLHNHTRVSKDGQIPARELIDLAVERGVKGLGICDHDEFPDENLYDYAQAKGLKLALGVEFSCDDAHIIGYNMDVTDGDRAFLEGRFDQLRVGYFDASKEVIKMIQERGIDGKDVDISVERVQEYSGRETFPKLFIMRYLAHELDLFPSWSEARKYLQNKDIYVSDGNGTDVLEPTEAINLIHRAGGVAIWAHPFITSEKNRDNYFKQFGSCGVDAVEAAYAYKQNGYKGDESNEELERIVRGRLEKMGIAVSGGSDSHFPLKTYSDGSPIMPGDFGLNEEEIKPLEKVFG